MEYSEEKHDAYINFGKYNETHLTHIDFVVFVSKF